MNCRLYLLWHAGWGRRSRSSPGGGWRGGIGLEEAVVALGAGGASRGAGRDRRLSEL